MENNLRISWYGRCCFLVEIEAITVLFDPYDQFCNVDIGFIDSNILLTSSTWHDHGHIGASPNAWVYSYPGEYEHSGIKITGIESREDRGTPNIIFNIQHQGFSITNFADFGPTQETYFDSRITESELNCLRSTNIAFVRAMIERDTVGEANVHNDNFLKYCSPNIVIPEHYHPRGFIHKQIPEALWGNFEPANVVVDELPGSIGYPLEEINDYQMDVSGEFSTKNVFRFMQLHPQVKYLSDSD